MRYDVDFSIQNNSYSGVANVENDRIDLCSGPKNTGLSWALMFLGAFLGVRIGGTLFIVLLPCLGYYIGRRISIANGAEKVYSSFKFQEVVKISHLDTNNRAVYRVYVKPPVHYIHADKEPTDFIKIVCNSGTAFDSFMKTTFADVITEVDH